MDFFLSAANVGIQFRSVVDGYERIGREERLDKLGFEFDHWQRFLVGCVLSCDDERFGIIDGFHFATRDEESR